MPLRDFLATLTRRVPSVDAEAGTIGNRYRLRQVLGSGGMATVHLADDLKHRRQVAVKLMHPQLAAQLGDDRFLREIEIAAQLNHPHILTLIDSGADGGGAHGARRLYYVMPYVEGSTLRRHLDEVGRLAVEEAVAITRQVGGALGYAHGRGVVHRDVKPENILLHQGDAIVTDFGIARAVAAGGGRLTEPGIAMGTPAYMSPEQATARGDIDGRSDLYALACVLYEMLCGVPPFADEDSGDLQALLLRRLTGPPTAPRLLRPELPLPLESALMRALERQPAARPSDVHEWLALLQDPGVATVQLTPAGTRAVASLAVLPFADLGQQKDQEWFGDGLADQLIGALAKIGALRVAARTSSFAFKGRNEDVRAIGRTLGVDAVLEGSVRRAGNRLRVSVQLVDVANGYQLWSERFDRELEDVFAIEDEICDSIVRALRVVLSDEERHALDLPRAANVQAWEHYLRGRELLLQFQQRSLEFARDQFERATAIDASFALAHAGLADACALLHQYWNAGNASLARAEQASRRALELAPGQAPVHVSRALVLWQQGDAAAGLAELDEAIRLDPRLFDAYLPRGRLLLEAGRFAEAIDAFEAAARVRSEDFQSHSLRSQAHAALRQHDRAVAARERAVALATRHLELNPGDVRALYLGAADLAALGQRARSLEWAARAEELAPGDSVLHYNLACTFSLLGERDRALDHLERAVAAGFTRRSWLEHDSELDPLREAARFQALLASLPPA